MQFPSTFFMHRSKMCPKMLLMETPLSWQSCFLVNESVCKMNPERQEDTPESLQNTSNNMQLKLYTSTWTSSVVTRLVWHAGSKGHRKTERHDWTKDRQVTQRDKLPADITEQSHTTPFFPGEITHKPSQCRYYLRDVSRSRE